MAMAMKATVQHNLGWVLQLSRIILSKLINHRWHPVEGGCQEDKICSCKCYSGCCPAVICGKLLSSSLPCSVYLPCAGSSPSVALPSISLFKPCCPQVAMH